MHQPSLQPHSSSYLEYKIFPFVRPPEMDSTGQICHPVVIVGAGPIGLVLAIQLALLGLRVVLIEADAQVSGGSRALALTRRSMEIFEQCGVGEQFSQHAIVWNEGRSYYKGQVVHELVIPQSEHDKFSAMTNLGQCVMEMILVDRARELGVDLRFQTLLNDLQQSNDCVALQLDTPEGEYELVSDWVVAADGARSTVRRLQNLRFEGESFDTSRFVIADFNIDIDAPPGRRCYFEPSWLPGHSVLMHKAPHNVWRLDYQVPVDISDEQALDRERIRSHIQAHLDLIGVDSPWTFEWVTLYKPNALTLARYNHGRLLYCGDAAHLLPVFGVRGMNTGLQDSINLAWKLAAVVAGQSAPEILDSYSSERVADARQICVEAGRSTRMMAPPTRGYQVLQQAVLSLALDHEFVRGLLHWRTSHPIDYAGSPLTWQDDTEAQFMRGPRPGAPASNVQLQAGNRTKGHLLDAVQPAFNVLVFGRDDESWSAAREDVLAARSTGLQVRLIAVRNDDVLPADADASVHDVQGLAAERWGATLGAVYVLRPDQHVCARWMAGSPTRVAQVLDHAIGATESALA